MLNQKHITFHICMCNAFATREHRNILELNIIYLPYQYSHKCKSLVIQRGGHLLQMQHLNLSQFAKAGKQSCSNRQCEQLCGLQTFVVGVNTFFVSANQVVHYKVKITNFSSLFKPQIHTSLQEHFHRQKSDPIKIQHLYSAGEMTQLSSPWNLSKT